MSVGLAVAIESYEGLVDGASHTFAVRDFVPPVDPTRSNPNPHCGERALLLAVLHDAILCLTGEGVPKRDRARVAAEARCWMESRSRKWLFAFESICDVLGFNADYLRGKLLGRTWTRQSCDRRTRPDEEDIVHRLGHVRLRGNQTSRELCGGKGDRP